MYNQNVAFDDIQLKLTDFLNELQLFDKEMQAIYLMVEIRKLIEHGSANIKPEYKNIKFYCDWTLHTEKTRNFIGIEDIFEKIYLDCKKQIENNVRYPSAPSLISFLYFEVLKDNLLILFTRHNIPTKMLEQDQIWISFIKRLLEILTDQPIKNTPNSHLKEICIIGANDQAAAIRIYFSQPIRDSSGIDRYYYQLGNVF